METKLQLMRTQVESGHVLAAVKGVYPLSTTVYAGDDKTNKQMSGICMHKNVVRFDWKLILD